MTRKKIIVLSLILFILVALLGIAWLGSKYIKYGPFNKKVVLESQVSGYSLHWNDYWILNKIIKERGVFDKGVFEKETKEIKKVKNMKIILVPEETGGEITTKWKIGHEPIVAISGNYELFYDTLIIKIYILPKEYVSNDKKFRNSAFNEEVITQVYLATSHTDFGFFNFQEVSERIKNFDNEFIFRKFGLPILVTEEK